ncbi:MAG: hypothetical protein NUV57_04990, partial [archaeon]|nr:hypothetical protein [archaeon]
DAFEVKNEDMSRINLIPTKEEEIAGVPWFCDAVQSTIEIDRKNTQIKKVADEIAKTTKEIGECSDMCFHKTQTQDTLLRMWKDVKFSILIMM